MRPILAAIVVGLVAGMLPLAPVLAAGTEPSTTTIDPATGSAGVDLAVTVTVSGAAGTPTGTVELYDVTGGGETLLGSHALSGGTVGLTIPGQAAGTYDIEARYQGDATYDVSTGSRSIVFRAPSTTTLLASHTTIQTHHPVTLTAEVTVATADPDGSVTFRRSLNGGAPVVIGTAAIVGTQAELVVPSLPVGSVSITATWNGNASYEGSTSDPVAITVTADTVQTTGGCSAPTTSPPARLEPGTLRARPGAGRSVDRSGGTASAPTRPTTATAETCAFTPGPRRVGARSAALEWSSPTAFFARHSSEHKCNGRGPQAPGRSLFTCYSVVLQLCRCEHGSAERTAADIDG